MPPIPATTAPSIRPGFALGFAERQACNNGGLAEVIPARKRKNAADLSAGMSSPKEANRKMPSALATIQARTRSSQRITSNTASKSSSTGAVGCSSRTVTFTFANFICSNPPTRPVKPAWTNRRGPSVAKDIPTRTVPPTMIKTTIPGFGLANWRTAVLLTARHKSRSEKPIERIGLGSC